MSINMIPLVLTIIGLGGLIMGLVITRGVIKTYHVEILYWRFLLCLLFFFILGYIVFVYLVITTKVSFHNLLTSVIFFGGGIFVALVTTLTKKTIQQVQSLKQLEFINQELRYTSEHDDLTGLYKRRYFENSVKRAIELARKGNKFAVMFVDVNDFKIINDSAGHVAGDQILVALSKALLSNFREEDVVARIGGDEFAVLLQFNQKADLTLFANGLLRRVNDIHVYFNNIDIRTSISVGITKISGNHCYFHDIMNTADKACYEAKHRSNGVSNYAIREI